MCIKKQEVDKVLIDRNIQKPVFDRYSRNWVVRYIHNGKWTKREFPTEQRAYNFYFDRVRLLEYWIVSRQISNHR